MAERRPSRVTLERVVRDLGCSEVLRTLIAAAIVPPASIPKPRWITTLVHLLGVKGNEALHAQHLTKMPLVSQTSPEMVAPPGESPLAGRC